MEVEASFRIVSGLIVQNVYHAHPDFLIEARKGDGH